MLATKRADNELNSNVAEKKLNFLNEYVTNRQGYVQAFKSGDYVTNKGKLNDYIINRHVEGAYTVGVKVNKVTKFLMFDIDKEDLKAGKKVAKKIINTLLNEFELSPHSIILSFSGKKGYHVDILFKIPIELKLVERFKNLILYFAGVKEGLEKNNCDGVEIRGINKQGAKLPLGLHPTTRNYCNIISLDFKTNYDNNYVPSLYGRLDKLDLLKILEKYKNIKTFKTNEVKTKPKTKIKKVKPLHTPKIKDLDQVLAAKRLVTRGTRNKLEFLLSLYGNTLGYSENETLELIKEIYLNTPKELFNDDTTLEWKLDQAAKTIKNVINNGFTLFSNVQYNTTVTIKKDELLTILEQGKTINEMNVLFLHLLFSKIYGEKYFMSHETMAEYTGITRQKTVELVKRLVDRYAIEVIRKAPKGSYNKMANVYKCNISELAQNKNRHKDTTLELNEIGKFPTFQNVVIKLISADDVRQYVKRTTFENHFKYLYNNSIIQG